MAAHIEVCYTKNKIRFCDHETYIPAAQRAVKLLRSMPDIEDIEVFKVDQDDTTLGYYDIDDNFKYAEMDG